MLRQRNYAEDNSMLKFKPKQLTIFKKKYNNKKL